MAKTGPKGPMKPMDDKEFKQLIGLIHIQCTREEICSVLSMSEDTLNRRLKERGESNFAVLFRQNREGGKCSLRRAQWKKAVEDGNPALLIWLGKQMLGQTDKQQLEHTGKDGGPIVTIDETKLSTDALRELLNARTQQ